MLFCVSKSSERIYEKHRQMMRMTWHLEPSNWDKHSCEEEEIYSWCSLRWKCTTVPILAFFIRLVFWADCCSEVGSVVFQGLWLFPEPGGGLGISSIVLLMAGSRPGVMQNYLEWTQCVHLHSSTTIWFLSLKQPILLVSCVPFQSYCIQIKNSIGI